MSTGGHGTKWRRNTAENFNRLSRVHERYRRQTDRRTDDSERERLERQCLESHIHRTYSITRSIGKGL